MVARSTSPEGGGGIGSFGSVAFGPKAASRMGRMRGRVSAWYGGR